MLLLQIFMCRSCSQVISQLGPLYSSMQDGSQGQGFLDQAHLILHLAVRLVQGPSDFAGVQALIYGQDLSKQTGEEQEGEYRNGCIVRGPLQLCY